MSEIEKYKKYLSFKANPRYLRRDFIVPLYTGTEPDIVPETSVEQQGAGSYTPFPNDMPIVSPKEIQNQPYEQLNLAEGGSVERRGFGIGGYIRKAGSRYALQIGSKNSPTFFYKSYPTKSEAEKVKKLKLKEIENKIKNTNKGYFTGPELVEYIKNKKGIDTSISSISGRAKRVGIETKKNIFGTGNSLLYKIPNDKQLNQIYSNQLKATGSTEAGKKAFNERYSRIKELLRKGNSQAETNRIISKEFPEVSSVNSSLTKASKELRKEGVNIVKGTTQEKLGINVVNKLKSLYPDIDFNFNEYKYGVPETDKNFYKIKSATGKIAEYSAQRNKNIRTTSSGEAEKKIREAKKIISQEEGYLTKKGISNLDLSHRASLDQLVKLKEDYLSSNLGIDPQDINRIIVKPVENTLKDLYSEQSKISKKAAKVKTATGEIPKSIQKELSDINLKINNLTASIDNRLNPVLIDEITLEPKIVGVDYSKSVDLGIFNKPVKELTKTELEFIKTKTLPEVMKTQSKVSKEEMKKLSLNILENKDIPEKNKEATNKFINSLGCPTTYAIGGRVNFSDGSNCFNKGLKALEEGKLTREQLNVAGKVIAESGEEGMLLKNLLSKAGTGFKFTGLGVKELISVGAGSIGLGVGALLESGQAIPELAKGDWREAIRSTTLGFLPESVVGSRRTDLLRMAKTDEEKNAAKLLFDYQDKVEEANRIQGQIEALKNPEFTSVEGYESDPGMKIKELEGKLNDLDSFLNLNIKKVNKVTPTIVKLSDRLVESNVSNIIDPATGKPTIFGKIIGTTSVQDKKKLSEDIQKQAYQEEETETETKPFEVPNVVSPDDYINELQQYNFGGRVGFKDGGGPKISRRGFLGFLAGAAAAPFAGKLIKGEKAAQATKVAAKVLPKVSGMPEWFPSLVARIEKEGIDISPKATRVEDIRTIKKIEVPVLGKEKPDIIKMTQYPNGAIHIEADVYGGAFDSPFDLHYRPPKSDIDLETGKQIVEPGEFSVIETRPRPVYDPHSADYELEYENMSVKDAISDLERVEKIATGKRIHPKRVEQREKARADVEDKPYEDIINRYGDRDIPDWWDPSDYASGGRVGFAGGGSANFLKMLRSISNSLSELKQSTHMLGNTLRTSGKDKAVIDALIPYRNKNSNRQQTIIEKIENAKEYLPKEYHSTLDEMKILAEEHQYDKVDDMARALDQVIDPNLKFENLPLDMFPMADPLNEAFIVINPKEGRSVGRYTLRTKVNPETGRGTYETYDTWDPESKRFYREGEEKLKGLESIEKGKEGLN